MTERYCLCDTDKIPDAYKNIRANVLNFKPTQSREKKRYEDGDLEGQPRDSIKRYVFMVSKDDFGQRSLGRIGV